MCGVWRRVCVCHVDTGVCLCVRGMHFRMKWRMRTGHADMGVHVLRVLRECAERVMSQATGPRTVP